MNQRYRPEPSFTKFRYALRPAKNVERKMLCEALANLACIESIRSYRYVGFGSVEFVDFSLFHERLGIRDMLSIECAKEFEDRFEFNKPYSCITMKWGMSHEVLPTLDWTKRTIIWLDYDRSLNRDILADIQLVITSAKSGSVIIVTVNAEPERDLKVDDIHKVRLKRLRSRVGEDHLPLVEGDHGIRRSIRGADLAWWGLAKVSRQIIDNVIQTTLNDRNAALTCASQFRYKQLFNFRYADTAKMVTVGGILLNSPDESKLPPGIFEQLEFVSSDHKAYHIKSAVLTLRELRYLDRHLTPTGYVRERPNWLPKAECDKYGRIYRYFPTFTEVEA
jgi:hypothetical protein